MTAEDFKGLKALAELAGRRFHRGLVLYLGRSDALGKPNLKTWLHGLAAAADRPPLFVAAELDERTFRELKSQRAELRCDLSTWRTIPSAVLDALADSLAYEPDAVLDVFPRVEILWLDKGTEKSGRHRMWFAEYQCLSGGRRQ